MTIALFVLVCVALAWPVHPATQTATDAPIVQLDEVMPSVDSTQAEVAEDRTAYDEADQALDEAQRAVEKQLREKVRFQVQVNNMEDGPEKTEAEGELEAIFTSPSSLRHSKV